MLDSFKNKLFHKKYTSQLDNMSQDMYSVLTSPKGREEIVKSILYSKLPSFMSLYFFEVKGGKILSVPMFEPGLEHMSNKKRINLLNLSVKKGITPDIINKKAYDTLSSTALIPLSLNKNPIFHNRFEKNFLKPFDKSFISKPHLAFTQKRPKGIVEYAFKGENNDFFAVESRVFLQYKGQSNLILPSIDILFFKNGTYSYTIDSQRELVVPSFDLPKLKVYHPRVLELFSKKDIQHPFEQFVTDYALK